MKLEEIKRILSKNKETVAEKYDVREMGIFGSYARGEQKKGSDIDILVEFGEPPGLLGFIALEKHLEKLLGGKVDLVRKKALRRELRDSILAEAVYI